MKLTFGVRGLEYNLWIRMHAAGHLCLYNVSNKSFYNNMDASIGLIHFICPMMEGRKEYSFLMLH